MAAIQVIAAPTDTEAARLFTSLQQSFVTLRRGVPGSLLPPVDTMDGRWSAAERAGVEHAFSEAAIGAPDTVRRKLEAFLARTHVDELMITSMIYDHAARVCSFDLIAQIREAMSAATQLK